MIVRGVPADASRRSRRLAAGLGLAAAATLGACLWSTSDVVADANLQIELARVPETVQLVRVWVQDAAGSRFDRETSRSGVAMTLYVGHLATGPALVHTELVADTGEVTACRQDGVQVGPSQRARLAIDLALDTTETGATCNDGIDNDCNGAADCADDSCNGATRFCALGGCLGEQRCASHLWGDCHGLSPSPEKPANCADGIDNDCDGLTDCDDPDCAGYGC